MPDNLNVLPFFNVDDLELTELTSNDTPRYPLHIVNDMIFELLNDLGRNFDDNLINDFPNECKSDNYFSNSDFEFTGNDLKLLAYNINSVPLHLESLFDLYLNVLDFNFDIVGLCETRLNDHTYSLYKHSDYTSFFQNKSSAGGGLAIYMNNKFQGSINKCMSFQLKQIESLFVHVTYPYKFLVGIIYRPPNINIEDFLNSLEVILLKLIEFNKPSYLMGDFNINSLNYGSRHTHTFKNLFYTYSFSPTILKPTRVSRHSATLIDQIWTNDTQNYQTSGIIYFTLSDHFPIFCVFRTTSSKLCKKF